MEFEPLRLRPGADLRRELEASVRGRTAAFIVSGIGSLVSARLRFAGRIEETVVPGPLEILTLSGSLTADGAHLHMSIAGPDGEVIGGHVGYGNEIRTTGEVLLARLPDWALAREPDPATGYAELTIRCGGAAT